MSVKHIKLGSCSKYHEEICCCSAAKGHGMRIGEQYRIIREKFKTRICRLDLYNAISKFRRESTPGEEDAGMLLKRLHDKKLRIHDG
uniref:Uncharacterized protein n=1 Tax=Rhizophagus irregularis (strain DAOM 181602 / DAOM 197198 / MUCL 43194) TaxID=747089 RepID=U9URN0_RHIID